VRVLQRFCGRADVSVRVSQRFRQGADVSVRVSQRFRQGAGESGREKIRCECHAEFWQGVIPIAKRGRPAARGSPYVPWRS